MQAGKPLSILVASSEVIGFAKTGGLADVSGYLPAALRRRGHRVRVIMPLYRCVRNGKLPIVPTESVLNVNLNGEVVPTRLWKTNLPDSDAIIYFVENAGLFERDDPSQGRTIYQFTADGRKVDYEDNADRFAFFCKAVIEAIPCFDEPIDIVHANDWQTALLTVFLRELYPHRTLYKRIKTLFTIHNIAYQGVFTHDQFGLTGLPWRLFNHHQMEFYGKLNFLKSGVVFADWINTVSPTYSQEIRTTYFGCGLEGVLTERRDRLSGIVNGVDYDAWNPASDKLLPANYTPEDLSGKAVCKAAIQNHFGLAVEPRLPLLGMIARLVEQKGVDLVLRVAEEWLERGTIQLLILGEGDPDYQAKLQALQQRYPDRFGLLIGFDESLAHQIEAGSDLYLMPSMFEPSGLNQLYSLKYGTPPIVRATGGLSDTITDSSPENLENGTATGFRFQAYTHFALSETVRRAVELYHQSAAFEAVMRTGMRQDWSWDRAASGYEELYYRLNSERDGRGVQLRSFAMERS